MNENILLPLSEDETVAVVLGAISAGLPTELTGEVARVSMLEFLCGKTEGVYMLRVHGFSMFPEIRSGDVLIVDTHAVAELGRPVCAYVNGEYTLKRARRDTGGKLRLIASGGRIAHDIDERDDFLTVGKITHVVKKIF